MGVEEFKSYLPVPVFKAGVVRIEFAGVNGGGGVRVASVVGKEGSGWSNVERTSIMRA